MNPTPAPRLESPGLAPVRERAQQQKLHHTCQQFEAVLVSRMLQDMRKSTLPGGLFGSGLDNEIYGSFMDQAVAEKVAARGGFGVASMMEHTLADRIQRQDGAAPEQEAASGPIPLHRDGGPAGPPRALPSAAPPPGPIALPRAAGDAALAPPSSSGLGPLPGGHGAGAAAAAELRVQAFRRVEPPAARADGWGSLAAQLELGSAAVPGGAAQAVPGRHEPGGAGARGAGAGKPTGTPVPASGSAHGGSAARAARGAAAGASRTAGPQPAAPADPSAGAGPAPPAPSHDLEAVISQASRESGVDSRLLRAVLLTESAGQPRAVSPKGAAGLMQLMPDTARALGVKDVFDPWQNVRAGARYLAQLLEQFGGRVTHALAAYNAGPAAVERHGGVPPYPETRRYVRQVLQRLGRG